MFIRVQVNFTAQAHGGVGGLDTAETFDRALDLHQQADAAVADFIERRNRIFGSSLEKPCVTSVFFEVNGFWHVADRKQAPYRLRWPESV
jgi:hypothetical protein